MDNKVANKEKAVTALARLPIVRDIEEARQALPALVRMQEAMTALASDIKALKIINSATLKIKNDKVSDLAKMLTDYEKSRLEGTKPWRDCVDIVNDWLMPTSKEMKVIVEAGKKDILDFHKKQKEMEDAKARALAAQQAEEQREREQKALALEAMRLRFMDLCKQVIRKINLARVKEDFAQISVEFLGAAWPDFGELKDITQEGHDRLKLLGNIRWKLLNTTDIAVRRSTLKDYDKLQSDILDGEELNDIVEQKQEAIASEITPTDRAIASVQAVPVVKLNVGEVRTLAYRQKVPNINQVDPAFLMHNHEAIKAYMKMHKDVIEEGTEAGGLEFYYETSARMK